MVFSKIISFITTAMRAQMVSWFEPSKCACGNNLGEHYFCVSKLGFGSKNMFVLLVLRIY